MHKDKDIPGMRLATQGSIRRAACNIGHKKRIGVSNKWNIRISESFAGREAWAWEILCCDYHKFISPNKTIVLFQLLHFKWLLPLLSQWRQPDPKAYSLIRICRPNLLSTFLFFPPTLPFSFEDDLIWYWCTYCITLCWSCWFCLEGAFSRNELNSNLMGEPINGSFNRIDGLLCNSWVQFEWVGKGNWQSPFWW